MSCYQYDRCLFTFRLDLTAANAEQIFRWNKKNDINEQRCMKDTSQEV
jgi:hypothetical protein